MVYSHDVQFWKLTHLAIKKGRRRPHGVRWVVAGKSFSKWFEYDAQADNYRSQLIQAARKGDGFDTATGLPESLAREQQAITWYELACRFTDVKWARSAGKTRRAIADALATVTPAMVTTRRGMPESEALRAVLYGWAFHPVHRETITLDSSQARMLAWARDNSVKVVALEEKEQRSEIIRRALDTLALTMDGRPAAATTVARKRAVFYGALSYALELDLLAANPIDKVGWKAARVADQVDRRVVASPEQVRALLAAVETDQPELTAFFGCLYYAYLRPGEAVYLRKTDCVDLPSAGWGELLLTGNAPHAGAEWTDAGTARDERHLKHRAQKATRPVPIPPELVELIRRHMDRFGTARDGRLFHAPRGGMLGESTYGRIWRQARIKAFTASQARSPLAARPYDLRHSGVTLALNAGCQHPKWPAAPGTASRYFSACMPGASKARLRSGTGGSTMRSTATRAA